MTHGAELRLAFQDHQAHSFSIPQLKTASELLDRDISVEEIEEAGVLRGVTWDTGHFDMRLEGGLISGYVTDEFTEEEFARIDRLTNERCRARLQRTTVRQVTGIQSVTYVLDAQPL